MDKESKSFDYSELLTICIPTYNRDIILFEAIGDLIRKVERFGLRIVVVDNCSTDYTRIVVDGFKTIYTQLDYFCQTENKGFDVNFETALKLSKTPYTWILGDGNRLEVDKIEPLLIALDTKRPDAYIIDSLSRVNNIPDKTFTNVDELLYELGWHLTLLSSAIFSKKMIDNAVYEKYRNTHFIHFGLFFEYFGNVGDFTVLWENLSIINASKLPKLNGWNPYRVIEIFGAAWTKIVLSLPDTISLKSKKHCIWYHNEMNKLFTLKELKKQKAVGGLNYEIYQKYKKDIPYFAPGKRLLIIYCSLLPNVFNKYYRRFLRQGYL